jgi:hypothetical protein
MTDSVFLLLYAACPLAMKRMISDTTGKSIPSPPTSFLALASTGEDANQVIWDLRLRLGSSLGRGCLS